MNMEIILNSCRYICEEMGVILRNTAFSPNIKDRLDMSTAITDSRGRLIAQAEHIPVHVGSMSIGVRNIIGMLDAGDLREGDVIMTNDPYISGTHLNDVTMVSPIFHNGSLKGFATSKAHYVDVGGMTPGSLSSTASELYQEGIIIPPVHLYRRGELKREILSFFAENVRVKRYTIGDSQAQAGAVRTGVSRVKELFETYGDTVSDAWADGLSYVEKYTRDLIMELPDGSFSAEDYMEADDQDLKLAATISVKDDEMVLDFTGTDEQVNSPINAVFGVTASSATFALKSALDPDIPFNYGFLSPIKIVAPEGTILNPKKPAPVSAGNVETTQRIVDVIFKALSEFMEIPAASQGTMNNVMIGGSGWAFYETNGGGSGARPHSDGISGIQVNMTNTLNTPIESIEREYPLQITGYEFREGSGGDGKFKGGMGLIREIKVLEDATVTVVGERMRHGPWGLKGGGEGKTSRYSVLMNGKETLLKSKQTLKIPKGSILRIMTPGGGGYGNPKERE